MPRAVISGIGEVHPERRTGRYADDLALEAIGLAAREAGIVSSDLDGIVTESMLTPGTLSADQLIPALGINDLRYQALSSPVGAGILLAVAMAKEAIEAGLARHVLTFFAVDWGSHGSGPAGIHGRMDAKAEVEYPAGFRGPPVYFAALAHRYAHVYGLSPADLQGLLGEIACSARRNAAIREHAQVRDPLTIAEYLDQPYLAEPLRRSDISLLSDGAVAVVVSAEQAVDPSKRTVEVAAWSHAVESIPDQAFYTQSQELPGLSAAARVAARIGDDLGRPVSSADMFELYDCFSIATAMQLEALKITAPGRSLEDISGGRLDVGGSLPVNTHGGLLAHGYLLGAAHFSEAVRQLRHEALGNQVGQASTAFVGAGPGRQYTGLFLRRTDA